MGNGPNPSGGAETQRQGCPLWHCSLGFLWVAGRGAGRAPGDLLGANTLKAKSSLCQEASSGNPRNRGGGFGKKVKSLKLDD